MSDSTPIIIVDVPRLGPAQVLGPDDQGYTPVRLAHSNTTTVVETRMLKYLPTARLAPPIPGGAIRVAKGRYQRPAKIVLPSVNKARMVRHIEGFDPNREGGCDPVPDDMEYDATGAVSSAYQQSNERFATEDMGYQSLRPVEPVQTASRSKHELARLSRKQRRAYRLAELYSQGKSLLAIQAELAITRRELDELRAYVVRLDAGALQRPAKDRGRDELQRFKTEMLAAD